MGVAIVDEVFAGVPFFGAWMLAIISIVVGSIVLQKTGNVYLSVNIGLLSGIVTGSIFLLLGWVSTTVLLAYLALLAIAQFLR